MRQVDLDSAVGYALKRAQAALRAALDRELRALDLTVPQYSCLEQLAHQPAQTNAELARGTFVTRQAMHQLLSGMLAAGLVRGDGPGRFERFALTEEGEHRLRAASAAAAAVEDRMLAPLDRAARARLYADLVACAEALADGQ
jgi:DNA-binding MarR family transcriptional regulator